MHIPLPHIPLPHIPILYIPIPHISHIPTAATTTTTSGIWSSAVVGLAVSLVGGQQGIHVLRKLYPLIHSFIH